MSDEAVLRVVVEGGEGGAPGGVPAGTGGAGRIGFSQSQPPQPQPPPPAGRGGGLPPTAPSALPSPTDLFARGEVGVYRAQQEFLKDAEKRAAGEAAARHQEDVDAAIREQVRRQLAALPPVAQAGFPSVLAAQPVQAGFPAPLGAPPPQPPGPPQPQGGFPAPLAGNVPQAGFPRPLEAPGEVEPVIEPLEEVDYAQMARRRREQELERARAQAAYQNLYEGPGEALPAEGATKGGLGDVLKGVLGKAGLGDLAGAAGPAAAAAAYVAAMRKVTDVTEGAVRSVGDFAVSLTEPTRIGKDIETAGAAVSKFGDTVFNANPALGALNKVVGEGVQSFGRLIAGLDALAERYAAFSPVLAQAEAAADIRAVIGDIRRAQRLGPELARFVEVRSRLEQRIDDIKTTMLERMLPSVTENTEKLGGILIVITAIAAAFTADPIGAINNPLIAILKGIKEGVDEANRKNEDPGEFDPTSTILESRLLLPTAEGD